jgi:CotH kinase protein/Lamin Tail Domain
MSRRNVGLAIACAGLALGCQRGGEGAAAPVVFSEIMYHPVLETDVEEHEFLEIHNRGGEPLALGGWQIAGGVRFRFPDGTTLASGGYLVVARNRARLLDLPRYALDPAVVLGDYQGQLDNDGERLLLQDAAMRTVDELVYDDLAPWPEAADALGAGEAWLPESELPLERHRFMGRSLERRDPARPSTWPGNWEASPLDGATPGRPSSQAGAALGVVESFTVRGAARAATIEPRDRVLVQVRFGGGRVQAPELEWFADDIERDDEPTARLPLEGDGAILSAQLPAQQANTILRFRVWGERGRGAEVISPRPGDPRPWHAAFVQPPATGRTPSYRLFIRLADWQRLYENLGEGRVPGNLGGGSSGEFCALNPRWDARVPAVLAVGSEVYDIQARYQGSRGNRFSGPRAIDMTRWPAAVAIPEVPRPFQPLSWHFNFARHQRFQGQHGTVRSFNLSKLPDQSCQGFFARVANPLFEAVGVAAARTSYVRLYINGAYYHYMQQQEHVDEDLLLRHYGKDHEVGDLFKVTGARWDEGPFGFGDESPLVAHCGYSVDERYAFTYERQTHEDTRPGSGDVRALVEELHAARAEGLPALRAFFERRFDVARLTDYMVVRNWLSAWDDVWQNHYLYRRADGKFMVLPTDMDNHFGFAGPSAFDGSFFSGVVNGRSNYRDLPNYLKDSFLRVYRAEFLARVEELSRSVLHPDNVTALIDEALAEYALEEAKEAPAGITLSAGCGLGDPVIVANRMKSFVRLRHERVLDRLFD